MTVAGSFQNLRMSAPPRFLSNHQTSSAQDHHRAHNRRHVLRMVGFNADGYPASLETILFSARNRHHERNKTEDQHHQSNPKHRFHSFSSGWRYGATPGCIESRSWAPDN